MPCPRLLEGGAFDFSSIVSHASFRPLPRPSASGSCPPTRHPNLPTLDASTSYRPVCGLCIPAVSTGTNDMQKVIDKQCTFVLFSPVFVYTEPRSANQYPCRSTSLAPSAPFSLYLCHRDENADAVTPLFATHTSRPQISENTTALSPFLATHTDLSPVSRVFATHTKTGGCIP